MSSPVLQVAAGSCVRSPTRGLACLLCSRTDSTMCKTPHMARRAAHHAPLCTVFGCMLSSVHARCFAALRAGTASVRCCCCRSQARSTSAPVTTRRTARPPARKRCATAHAPPLRSFLAPGSMFPSVDGVGGRPMHTGELPPPNAQHSCGTFRRRSRRVQAETRAERYGEKIHYDKK